MKFAYPPISRESFEHACTSFDMINDEFNDLRENSRFYGVKVAVQVRDVVAAQLRRGDVDK